MARRGRRACLFERSSADVRHGFSADSAAPRLVNQPLHIGNLSRPFLIATDKISHIIASIAVAPRVGLAFDPTLHRFRQSRSEENTSELQSLMRTSYAVFC